MWQQKRYYNGFCDTLANYIYIAEANIPNILETLVGKITADSLENWILGICSLLTIKWSHQSTCIMHLVAGIEENLSASLFASTSLNT